MEELLKKISEYDILNKIVPGVIFVTTLNVAYGIKIEINNFLESLLVFYACGEILSRIGAIILEDIFKKFIKFADYTDYVEASKVDKKIDLFNKINNMYRTLISLFSTLFFINIVIIFLKCNHIYYVLFFIFLLLTLLFIKSYIRQTKFIVKRVNIALNKDG